MERKQIKLDSPAPVAPPPPTFSSVDVDGVFFVMTTGSIVADCIFRDESGAEVARQRVEVISAAGQQFVREVEGNLLALVASELRAKLGLKSAASVSAKDAKGS